MPIKVQIAKDYDELSKKGAEIIADSIRKKPNLILGLATVGTPVSCYQELIHTHSEERLDFSRVVTFNLDGHLGLPPIHPQSYRYFMDENLFHHVNIKMENTHVLNGMPNDPQKTCKEFVRALLMVSI